SLGVAAGGTLLSRQLVRARRAPRLRRRGLIDAAAANPTRPDHGGPPPLSCKETRCTSPSTLSGTSWPASSSAPSSSACSPALPVLFALAAGLSGTDVVTTTVVVTAGLAEVAAGSIAMGLGGYLAAKSDAEHYASEKHREEVEVVELPDVEREEVAVVFRDYGLTESQIEPILQAFEKNHPAWVDFMMRFELGLEEPDPRRALRSAMTIAGAYIAGGLIPLSPYMFVAYPRQGLVISSAVTAVALAIFGYIKGMFTGT